MGSIILFGAKVGAAYAIGRWGGAWIVTKAGLGTNDAVRVGTQVATGLGSYVVLSLFIR